MLAIIKFLIIRVAKIYDAEIMFSIVCYTNCCKVNVLLVQTKKKTAD